MKYRVIGAFAVVVMFVLVMAGVAFVDRPAELFRYHQHEESRSLEDLGGEDQKAASSLDTSKAHFASHLPVISITTDGSEIPGRPLYANGERALDENGIALDMLAADGMPTIPVQFALYDNESSEDESLGAAANRLGDKPLFETQAEMRVRGHSSSAFDKPSYRVTFTLEDRVTPNPHDVLDMGVEQDWVLHGPYLDKSLIRNYIAMNLFGCFMPYTPDVRFVELFLDGEYQGLYVLMETIKHDSNRVDIQDTDSKSVDTSFLVKRDWYDNAEDFQLRDFINESHKATSTVTTINYPNEQLLTQEQKEYIEDHLNQIEKALYSFDYDTPEYGYWKFLDVASFVDYALANEIALNEDAGKFSSWLYQDLGGKLSMGPIWDFNNAFDNGFEQSILGTDFIMLGKPLYAMLYRDEGFTEKVISRYRELREKYLSDEFVSNYIDDVVEYLGPAIERNYAVWGYTLDPKVIRELDKTQRLEPVSRNPVSHEEAIADLKNAFMQRLKWLDSHIEILRQYSHESAVKEYNH